ncbi:enoyl-CoA hydratase/isomerase family protein [Novosphingobium sp. G106]|uniref:enoyl-CoA hydratase/isomerase family protein n=1 Tax=Novosphingobium sp. G106 TaxID=2849500 RepID=UPI001C2D00C3|nr:enoyl-CoA hydratase/isomerase family protein [Novosphingobium sp. G106]MBV1688888.1 enoyl-CoA hydratase/isomerase family protein [Novosphingobium sp. G106]
MSVSYATEAVLLDVSDGIATITLNRPSEGNAITRDLTLGMQAIWAEVKRNPDIRVAIVTGAGERHFCTGASAGGLKGGDEGLGLANGPLNEVVRLSPHHNDVWKPVICIVNGLCNGGGLHFVVDSDIVVAPQTAAFMDTHVNLGQVGALENIGLARRMTLGSALLLTLVGRDYRMSAERAHQLGLVDILEPTLAEAVATGRKLAASIARNSPQAVTLSKQALWASMELGYKQAQELGWQFVKQQWNHPDFDEGPRAFMEKRQPEWNPDPNARR